MANAQKKMDKQVRIRCKEAIRFLRKTHIKVDHQSITLSRLPAYLVIGSPDSGKTSLITESELKFVLEKKQKNNVLKGATSSPSSVYDFWATSQAVFIDTPGIDFDAATPDSSSRFKWFLNCLRKNNYSSSIQGVLVVLDLQQLFQSHKSIIKKQVESIQQRLNEIQASLHRTVPVFLVLNKCDFISGFKEFFSSLSREERYQLWGPPIVHSQHWLAEFQKGFAIMLYRLNDRLMKNLLYERNLEKRLLMNLFISQMYQLRNPLMGLMDLLNETIKNFSLFGIFFTSAFQSNHLKESTSESASSIGRALIKIQADQSQSFFIHDLLNDYILKCVNRIPEKPLKRYRYLRLGFYLLALAVIGSVIYFCLHELKQQFTLVDEAQNALDEYRINKLKSTSNFAQSLQQLNILKTLRQRFADQSMHFLLYSPSLTTFKQLNQTVQDSYQLTLHHTLSTLIQSKLVNWLKDEHASPEQVYSALQLYLLFNEPSQWDRDQFLDIMRRLGSTQFSDEERLLLDQYLEEWINQPKELFSIPPSLIEQARNRLKKMKSLDLAYVILTDSIPNNSLLSLNLNANQTAAAVFTVADQSIQLRRMYTTSYYHLIQGQDLFTQSAKEALAGNKVIGPQREKSDSASAISGLKLKEQLLQLYLKNYAASWHAFLENIRVINYTEISKLLSGVSLLSTSNSPLEQLINLVQSNLIWEVEQADATLRAWSHLKVDFLKTLKELRNYLSPLQNLDSRDKVAFRLSSLRMRNSGVNDPLGQLFLQAQSYPDPLKSWFYLLGVNTWQLLLFQTENYLNSLWKSNIVAPYQEQLTNKFPINSSADQDVAWTNFTYFFAPNGALDNFFATYLKPFIDESQTDWKSKVMDEGSLQLSSTTFRFFQSVYKLQRLYFGGHLFKPMISFEMQPISMMDTLSSVTVIIGSQKILIPNTTALAAVHFEWPDPSKPNVTEIIFKEKNGQMTQISDPRPWGLFHILQKAGLRAVAPNQWRAVFDRNGRAMMVRLVMTYPDNPFSLEHFQNLTIMNEL